MLTSSAGHRLTSVALALAAGVVVALLIQNNALRRTARLLAATRRDANRVDVRPGDSLRQFRFRTALGEPASAMSLAKGEETVFCFYRPDCPSCMSEWPAWQQALDARRFNKVIFVNCDSSAPRARPPLEQSEAFTAVDLLAGADDRMYIRHVPTIVRSDGCAVALEVERSVKATTFPDTTNNP